jgi:heptosyltransferase III
MSDEHTDRLPSASIRSVLLLTSGALGDTVLQLRIAEAMRYAMPATRITWLGRDDHLPIARRCLHIEEALGLDAVAAHRLFRAGSHTDADLADMLSRFDVIINGLAGPGSPVLDRLRRFARHAAVAYDTRPQPGVTRHVCRQWLEQVAVGLTGTWPAVADDVLRYAARLQDTAGILLEPRIEDGDDAAARLHAASIDSDAQRRRLILLHPGSGGLHKCYPLEQYVRLCRLLTQRRMQPVMLLGPAELDRWGDRMSQLVRHCTLIVDPPLPLLMGLIRHAAGYIGNDSGPTHVAAATGVTTLALFGPTDPRIWRPLGPQVAVLRSQEHERGWCDLQPEDVVGQLGDF